MKNAKIMSDSILELAQYHEVGYAAIGRSFDKACILLRADVSFEEFYEKINIREIDDFEFMYDADKDSWADADTMTEYFVDTFGELMKK